MGSPGNRKSLIAAVDEARKERRQREHRKWYARVKVESRLIRWWLWDVLGRECYECGTTLDLTFDHPHGRDYDIRRLNCYRRAQRYLFDYSNGNLRLLCGDCNSFDGGYRRYGVTRT